ncbi:MAG: hypothetical protein QOD29_2810, partial [Alphaproteobacteria bacterium]|nr:hypothetical protein [Alphaproteobacteria bacterium]
SNLGIIAENFQRSICARVIICNYRIDMLTDVLQGVP